MERRISPETLQALGKLGSSAVSNAIESFGVRLRNAGFMDSSIRCLFPELPPVVGYAATARLRTSLPPMSGRNYYDRTDWWASIVAVPPPRVVVVQDVDKRPGLGSLVGKVHAAILQALGCVAVVTNGAVRGLDDVRRAGFQFFAGNVAVSHAYAHIFEFGTPVEVGGLRVEPGDLLHGDLHGIVQVPLEIAAQIPAVAPEMKEREERIVALCASPEFSVEKLRNLIHELSPEPEPNGLAPAGLPRGGRK